MFESEASPRRLLGQEGYAAVAAVAPLTCLTSVTTISFSPRIVAAAHGMEIENGIKVARLVPTWPAATPARGKGTLRRY